MGAWVGQLLATALLWYRYNEGGKQTLVSKDTRIPRGKSINRIWVGRQSLSWEGTLSKDGHTLEEMTSPFQIIVHTLGLFMLIKWPSEGEVVFARMSSPRKVEHTLLGLVGRATTSIIYCIWRVYKVWWTFHCLSFCVSLSLRRELTSGPTKPPTIHGNMATRLRSPPWVYLAPSWCLISALKIRVVCPNQWIFFSINTHFPGPCGPNQFQHEL